MAISYLSKTYHANPYILPLDLDLFGKVMGAKQNAFDSEAAKIQGQIDQFASLDIMKSNVKDYANRKLTETVNSVNGMGGMDLSDPNVSSRIESGISGIYNDNIIINGIAGTKQARSLIAGYDDYKNNPKQKGKYSVANETLDLEKVHDWLNDGQLDSSYQGSSSPTPYVDYKKSDLENLKSLPSSQYQTITQGSSTLVFDKVNHEYLTPQQVMSVAAGLRTPDERAQVKRDAVYFSKYQANYSPQQLQDRFIEQNLSTLDSDYNGKLKELSTDLLAAANDNEAKKKIQASINDLNTSYKSNVALFKTPEGRKRIADSLQANPEEFMYNVYNNDYTTALGNRFAFDREKRDLVWNQGEMFNQRQRMELLKVNQDQAQFNANLGQRQEEMKIDMASKGIIQGINPLTGQRQYIKVGGFGTGSSGSAKGSVVYDAYGNALPEIPLPSGDNSANPNQYKVDENTIKTNIQTSLDSSDTVIANLLNNMKTLHPELAQQYESSIYSSPTSVMDILQAYKSKGNPDKFEASDFQDIANDDFIKSLVRDGMIKQGDVDAFAKMAKLANDASSNQGGTVRLPAEYQSAYEQLLPLQENVRYNQTILKQRDEAIKNVLSPEEQKRFVSPDGSINWNKINTTSTDNSFTPDESKQMYNPNMNLKNGNKRYVPSGSSNSNDDEVVNRMKEANDDYFKNKMSLRPEFSQRSLAGKDNEEQQNMYGTDLFNSISAYERQRNSVDLVPNNIILRGVGRATDGSAGYQLSYDYPLPHKKNEPQTYTHRILKVGDLPPNTASAILQRFDLDEVNPYQHVDDILGVTNSTMAYSYPTANTEKPFNINSRIVNLDKNNPNSTSFALQFGFPKSGVTTPDPTNFNQYDWTNVIKMGQKGSILAAEAASAIKSYKPSKFANDNNLLKEEFQFYTDPNNRDKNFEQYYKSKH